MKRYLIGILSAVIFVACTKQEVIDTGTADPAFEGSMMEYLRSDDYNWELTVALIEHAGLTDLFDGRDPQYPKITFFGFKSYSVQRFLFDSQYKDQSEGVFTKVGDIPVDMARELVLKHVIKGNHLKEDIAYRNKEYVI